MKKNLTEIVFILDRSGSMSAVRCSAPLGTAWKARIDEDFRARKHGGKR